MMEVSGIFWHLHTIMTLSLVIQYGTLLSPNQDRNTRIYSSVSQSVSQKDLVTGFTKFG